MTSGDRELVLLNVLGAPRRVEIAAGLLRAQSRRTGLAQNAAGSRLGRLDGVDNRHEAMFAVGGGEMKAQGWSSGRGGGDADALWTGREIKA
jgi:hypothetical protein